MLHDLLYKNVREHWAHKSHLLPFNIVKMYNNHLRVINFSFVLDNYETNDS